MDVPFSALQPSMYQVANVPLTGTVTFSVRKLAIATQETPDVICGQAVRVGYTGMQKTDLALYRLKVKSVSERLAVTLTDLYVLELGIFHVYQQKAVTQTNET